MCEGPGPLQTVYDVTIAVQDINDNPPVFNAPFSASFEEGKTGFITSPNITDADSGINAMFTLQIVSGNKIVFSILNGRSIQANMELDFETQTSYTLLLEATDQGSPPLSSRMNYTIDVKNINDMPPVFIVPPAPNSQLAFIPEDFALGDALPFTLSATDADAPPFDEVRFYFATNVPVSAQNHFSIEPASGLIRVTAELDREAIPTFSFDVHAFDGTFNTTGTVEVILQDVDDNPPVFLPPFQFSIAENATNDTVIGTVRISDRDIPPNDDAMFRLFDSQLPFRLRGVGTQSAELLVSGMLDFETQSSYSIAILALDDAGRM